VTSAIVYLAHCCDARVEQLSRLARRCRDVGLAPRHVDTLRQLSEHYREFATVLWRCAEELGVRRDTTAPPGPISDTRIDDALSDVYDSDLPSATIDRIRTAHERLSRKSAPLEETDGITSSSDHRR
jgi:hypothetical protein